MFNLLLKSHITLKSKHWWGGGGGSNQILQQKQWNHKIKTVLQYLQLGDTVGVVE